jgi:hypothetical protein
MDDDAVIFLIDGTDLIHSFKSFVAAIPYGKRSIPLMSFKKSGYRWISITTHHAVSSSPSSISSKTWQVKTKKGLT